MICIVVLKVLSDWSGFNRKKVELFCLLVSFVCRVYGFMLISIVVVRVINPCICHASFMLFIFFIKI
jgi:hypothetical protein